MTSLIEAMARAIDPEAWTKEPPEDYPNNAEMWWRYNGPIRDVARKKAQAALSALQESGPTDEMVQAGCDVGPVGCCPLEPEQAREIFNAMLSATEGGE